LLRKAGRLGLDAAGLQRLAIQRGCTYYHGGEPLPPSKVSTDQFSNAELAIALLNPALHYHPQTLRLGAAMLSAQDNSPHSIARLAKWERCEPVVRYIAECGRRFEPECGFWNDLLEILPPCPAPKSGVVPHPTRFVAMTGLTRRGSETVVAWIRPTTSAPVHG
jgi:hypothetical protein